MEESYLREKITTVFLDSVGDSFSCRSGFGLFNTVNR